MFKNQKGITLVALVITIIVLIILAGVTISLLIGDNGIINKAKEGKTNMTNAQGEEQTGLNDIQNWMTNQGIQLKTFSELAYAL